MSQVVCYCKNVTKAEIEKAILSGAKTLSAIPEILEILTSRANAFTRNKYNKK